MRLAKSILVRLLFGLVSLIFISFVTFVADEITPGDAATIQAGEKARPEDVQNLRHQMGLDRPWLVRYVEFVSNAARFDFGRSYLGSKPEVSKIIGKALPMTLKIALLAILLAAAIGIFLGTIAGVYQNKAQDRAVLTLSTLGVTVPNFVLAPVLVYFFANRLDMLPQTWEVQLRGPEFYYLILPVVILSARPMASLTRLTRASVSDTLQQEFVRLATAKGVPPKRLVFRHVLRNALLPVITAIGTSFGFLLTGSFIIERAFLIPGLGSEAIDAILKRDTPVIQATVLVAGGLFILINLIVDLILPLLDPRIREAQV